MATPDNPLRGILFMSIGFCIGLVGVLALALCKVIYGMQILEEERALKQLKWKKSQERLKRKGILLEDDDDYGTFFDGGVDGPAEGDGTGERKPIYIIPERFVSQPQRHDQTSSGSSATETRQSGTRQTILPDEAKPVRMTQARRFSNPEEDESAYEFLSDARAEEIFRILRDEKEVPTPRSLSGAGSEDENQDRGTIGIGKGKGKVKKEYDDEDAASTTSSMDVQPPRKEKASKKGAGEGGKKSTKEDDEMMFEISS